MQEFKVGDWVVLEYVSDNDYCKEEVLQITDISVDGFCKFGNYDKLYHTRLLKLWQPKEGEWVWIKDTHLGIVMVEQYDDMLLTPTAIYEPFIGELPSFLKDK